MQATYSKLFCLDRGRFCLSRHNSGWFYLGFSFCSVFCSAEQTQLPNRKGKMHRCDLRPALRTFFVVYFLGLHYSTVFHTSFSSSLMELLVDFTLPDHLHPCSKLPVLIFCPIVLAACRMCSFCSQVCNMISVLPLNTSDLHL